MKRLFFAIPLPKEQREFLLHSFPQKNFHGIRWVNEKNLHITLHFLGATPEEKLKALVEESGTICKSSSSFQLRFESFKVIFKERKPVMIWAQFEESNAFEELCSKFRGAFPIDEKRKPLPHLTLARIKQLHQLPFDLPKEKSFSVNVNAVELWESHLDASGSDYNLLENWKLT